MYKPTSPLSFPTHTLHRSIPQAQSILLPEKYITYPSKMADQQRWGLYYNYDSKYAPCHKCKEQNLFLIDVTSPTSYEGIIMEYTPKFEDIEEIPPM